MMKIRSPRVRLSGRDGKLNHLSRSAMAFGGSTSMISIRQGRQMVAAYSRRGLMHESKGSKKIWSCRL